ncbi:MAG: hypothetical protein ACLFU8_07080 [Anaerolineales bacterium]
MKGKLLMGLVLVLLALLLVGCGAPSDAATLPVPAGREIGAVEGPETVTGSIDLFADDTFGYRFEMPAGWGFEEPDIHDPNLPPAGAMERLIHLRPEGWDEDFYPVSLAVYTSESAYRQDHMPGDVVEERAVNGGTLIQERYDYGERYALQYTFVGPDDLYVLFSDYFRGWPERIEGREEVAAQLEPLLASFKFTH